MPHAPFLIQAAFYLSPGSDRIARFSLFGGKNSFETFANPFETEISNLKPFSQV